MLIQWHDEAGDAPEMLDDVVKAARAALRLHESVVAEVLARINEQRQHQEDTLSDLAFAARNVCFAIRALEEHEAQIPFRQATDLSTAYKKLQAALDGVNS